MAEWTNIKALEELCHEYEVHWTVSYARVIEYGCPPHPVSEEGVRNIERWAQRKARIEYTTKSGNQRKRKLKEDEARDMAEAIAWKIRLHGQEPNPWVRPAVDDARSKAAALFKRNGTRAIADYVITRAQEYIDRKGIADTGKMGQTFTLTDITTGEVLENHGLGE
ncbi:MAG TPA: hypothetical protein PKZ73_05790 [Methanomassiliicoccales archaeon]|nr:hypothetical protein [Methanomassiliicoccales archaeon]